MAKVAEGAKGAKWLTFVTLTSVPTSEWSGIMASFSTLVRNMRKNGAVEYAAVKETGQKGMKHLHVLLKGPSWLSRESLSTQWKRMTGAWNVDVRRVFGSTKVGSYMAKYMSKSMAAGSLKKLITFSRNWYEKMKINPAFYVVHYAGRPDERQWEAVEEDGTLVEKGCKCMERGYKRGQYIRREGLGSCEGA